MSCLTYDIEIELSKCQAMHIRRLTKESSQLSYIWTFMLKTLLRSTFFKNRLLGANLDDPFTRDLEAYFYLLRRVAEHI